MSPAVTLPMLPWDVPVRLVPAGPDGITGDGPERTVHLVDPGVALPGVPSVRVTVLHAGGAAALERIEAGTTAAVDGMLGDLLARSSGADGVLPVTVQGSPFARSVLERLSRVPVGGRVTYAGLAAAVGRPRAFRAVASVMARNRVPLVLPCHRVVPSSGGTGRYAWGDAVKAVLLDVEAVVR